MLFDYDDGDELSIYNYAKKLEGLTFQQICDEFQKSNQKVYRNPKNTGYDVTAETLKVSEEPGYITNKKAKGQLGGLLEMYYFGYNPNSRQEADFPKVGIELKQTPIDKTKKGELKAGERLSITNISFKEPVEDDFYKSHLWNKIKRILLVQYLRDRTKDRYEYEILYVNMFTPPQNDLVIIIEDYKTINDKIKAGLAHELSEGDTLYLGACTKGANAEKSLAPQYYGNHQLAKRRNYCFKQSYMNYVLHKYILRNEVPCESIFKSNVHENFEGYIIGLINSHIGQTDEQLCAQYNREYNNNKAQWVDLSYRMLGIKSNRAEEFEKANIVVKTIRIEENGKNKESMSFSPFKFKELVQEEWEDSTVYNYFESTKFLFVIFKNNGKSYTLKGCQLWHMPYHDLNETVRLEWTRYVETIKNGVEFTKTLNKKGEYDISNNLPGVKDTEIIHIRPHASKSAYCLKDGYTRGNIYKDGDQLPNGEWMTRQSFWINSSYILKQLKYK